MVFLCRPMVAFDSDRSLAQFAHTAWGSREGAPGRILALAQTPDGYLWLGSANDLFRFDGFTFQRYQPLNGPKLPEGGVRSLLALPNGDLWIGFRAGGISRLRSGRAENFTATDGIPDGNVKAFAQGRDGTLWAGTSHGLARFDGHRWHRVGKDWSFAGKSVEGLAFDRKGTLWVSAKDTLLYLPQGATAFQTTSVHFTDVPQIVEAPNGKLWLAETAGTVHPIPLNNDAAPMDQAAVRVGSQAFLFDPDGALWIATVGEGLARIPAPYKLTGQTDRSSDSVESFTSQQGLTDNVATSILRDEEGNIWVGTHDGLDRFRKTNLVPIVAENGLLDTDLLKGNDGDVWAASNQGVVRIHDNKTYPVTYPMGSLLGGYHDPSGTLWWLSLDSFLRYTNGQFTRYPLSDELKKVLPGRINITSDRSGTIWMVVDGAGLFRFENGNWKRFDTPAEIAKLTPTAAYTDDPGRLWFGYDGGTIVYFDGQKFQTVSTPQNSAVGDVRDIKAGYGRVWACGESGVALFDGLRFHALFTADGANFGAMTDLEESSDGGLWLRAEKGVVHIEADEIRKFLVDPTSRIHAEIFDSLDGLPGRLADRIGQMEVQDTKGRIWFATTNSVAWLNPAAISRHNQPPPASINTVIADGKHFDPRSDPALPARTGDLEFGYGALSLSIPERVRFRFRLDGVDKTWQEAGVRRAAYYTNLPPGKYQFHVNARNVGGAWNTIDTVQNFSIAPAWFQTAWFQAFYICIALLLLWLLYQLRLMQLRRQFHLALEVRVDERTRIARELHDTLLQSFNALLLRFQAVSNLLPARPDEAKQRVDSAIEQASNAITEGRDAVHELRAEGSPAIDLAESITNFGKDLLSAPTAGGPPELDVEVEGTARALDPIVRDEVYRIAVEALRNAIRHSRARRIEVEIHYDDRELRLRIRDNGKGIDAAALEGEHPPGHWGLRGMRERAKLIGGKFEVWSEPDSGTVVELSVPANSAYARPRDGHKFNFWRTGRGLKP